jgi:hypothetical protein
MTLHLGGEVRCIHLTTLPRTRQTDFLKVYTQYVYNFPKALTTFNACKQKAPFKAFLLVRNS